MKNKALFVPVIAVLAVMVIAIGIYILFFSTSGNFPSAKPDILLDDDNYSLSLKNAVKIPAGRPRVPQVICDEGDVYQAYFADGDTTAKAKVVCEDKTYEINFIKDKKLGFELQYDDRYEFVPSFDGASFTSSNSDVAIVTEDGQVIITGVSDEGVVITAQNGNNKEELVITKTIKAAVDVYMLTGQSNAAYFYAEPEHAVVTQNGSAYIYDISDGEYFIQSMNRDDVTMAFGNVEASLCKSLYENMGNKVIIVNAGISGKKIIDFKPYEGSVYFHIEDVWKNIGDVMATQWFKDRFEPTIRSYIWIQGESDDWLSPEKYVEDFMNIHLAFRSPELFGFDYGFISSVVPRFFRPNDAQERIAQACEDVYMATRITSTFSPETGELRDDNLHYTQEGDNVLGKAIGDTISLVYKGYGYTLPEGEGNF